MSRRFRRLQGRERLKEEELSGIVFFLSELSVYAHVYLPKLRSQRDLQDSSLPPCILSVCVSVYVSLPTCVSYFMNMCMNTTDFHMHVSDYISVCALAVYTISVMFTISVKVFTILVFTVIFVSHGQRDTWHRPADILLIFSQKLGKTFRCQEMCVRAVHHVSACVCRHCIQGYFHIQRGLLSF